MAHGLWVEIVGVAAGGLVVGGVVGGALAGVYRAADADLAWPRWADALATGLGYGLAAGLAAGLGVVASTDLHLGPRVAAVIAGVAALPAPSIWPGVRASLARAITSRIDDAGEGRR